MSERTDTLPPQDADISDTDVSAVAVLEARVDDLSARLERTAQILCEVLTEVLAARGPRRPARPERHLRAVPAGGPEAAG